MLRRLSSLTGNPRIPNKSAHCAIRIALIRVYLKGDLVVCLWVGGASAKGASPNPIDDSVLGAQRRRES
jgi:hypothetical protein